MMLLRKLRPNIWRTTDGAGVLEVLVSDLFTVALYPEEPPKPAAGSAHVWVMVPDRHDAWALTEWACREGIDLSSEQVTVLCGAARAISFHVETITDVGHEWLAMVDDDDVLRAWCEARGIALGVAVADAPRSAVDVAKARCACVWVKFEITEKHLGKVLALG